MELWREEERGRRLTTSPQSEVRCQEGRREELTLCSEGRRLDRFLSLERSWREGVGEAEKGCNQRSV